MPDSEIGSPKVVLLVEDNSDNRGIYRTILEHGGFVVLEAEDGGTGVDLARTRRPDLILMDVAIPVIDGWEATRMLKGDPDTASIPIIALTAHALQSDRARAEEVGCDGYIPKPVLPRVVLEEVQRRLGPADGGPPG
jgi:two-component system, cell cycle response regulator DivK